ncbi:MAG TPA: hypothetical protein VF503_04900 [Sphingobium sp.]|uniref:hypothetical protein n=1 Tax=Sphingobium sp. TaxID=1912891 RepID=UPI002ED44A14
MQSDCDGQRGYPHGDKGAVFAQKQRDQFIALRDGKPLPVFDDKDDAPPAGVPGAKAK